MRHVFSQIIILVLFLFLAAFASVWCGNSISHDDQADNSQTSSVLWISQAAHKVWLVLDYLTQLTSPSEKLTSSEPVSTEDYQNDLVTAKERVQEIVQDSPEAYNELNQPTTESMADTAAVKEDFWNFIGNLLKKSPNLYLDNKVYGNGWRDFWSLYWSKYREMRPE